MNIKSGLKLLEEEVGSGLLAERGDDLVYNVRAFLNKGDEVPINLISVPDEENMMKLHPELLNIQEGFAFINFNLCLGRRYACAGVGIEKLR